MMTVVCPSVCLSACSKRYLSIKSHWNPLATLWFVLLTGVHTQTDREHRMLCCCRIVQTKNSVWITITVNTRRRFYLLCALSRTYVVLFCCRRQLTGTSEERLLAYAVNFRRRKTFSRVIWCDATQFLSQHDIDAGKSRLIQRRIVRSSRASSGATKCGAALAEWRV